MIEVLQKGYRLGDHVLRPARVIIAVTTLYETLGVPKNASQDEIKKAYQARAREPSRPQPGDESAEARFKEVQGAYDVLKDPEKRKQYDQFGANGARPGQGGAASSTSTSATSATSATCSAGSSAAAAAGGRSSGSAASAATTSRRT